AVGVPVGVGRGRLVGHRRGELRRSRGGLDTRDAAIDRRAPAAGRGARGAARGGDHPDPRGARGGPRHRARVGADLMSPADRMRLWSTRVALGLVLLTASGCLSQITKETAQRMGRGPRATEVYYARAVSASGRAPS